MKSIYLTLFCILLFACKQNTTSEILKPETISDNQKAEPIIETNSNSENFKLLQGTWVNIDAPLSSLTFTNNQVINRYDGIDAKKNISFTIQNSCGTATPKETPVEEDKYIVTEGDLSECYYIVKIDQENLVLGFWGVETALRFKKKR